MSDTRAESLTKKLRKEFGYVPAWKVSTTQQCLDAHHTHWLIKRIYCGSADDYNRFRPLAKMVHRACKKEIGELPEVTEDMIKHWISVNVMDDTEIKAKYQLLYDEANPNMRKAKKLLAELRRDEGGCITVGEVQVMRWFERGFDKEAIVPKYKNRIKEATLFSRAEALRFRLQEELKSTEVASVPELLGHFRENLDDNAIIPDKYIREFHPALKFQAQAQTATLALDPLHNCRLPKDKIVMADHGAGPAASQLKRIPLGDWSRTEYLYIQLQSELLLAVACLPVTPRHLIDDAAQFIGYRNYFKSTDAATRDYPSETGNGVVKGTQAFFDKRDELSGSVMWALRQKSLAVVNEDSVPSFDSVQVTPDMLQDYRQIRERLGFDTYLYDPKLWPELWAFLQDAARNQFPEFSGDATQAGSAQDVGNNGDVDVDMYSNPTVAPGPVNDTAATSDHGPADGDEMPGADADADEEGDAEDNTEDDEDDEDSGAARPAAQPATRQGPDDFVLETGTVRCTEWSKETNSRCKRHADNENEDRRTWRCHNHDPVRKAKIKADRLARNRAAKAGKKGKMAKKAGVTKPKQQKKNAGKKSAK
ncbi:unnamed protein product [Alternaria alternata]